MTITLPGSTRELSLRLAEAFARLDSELYLVGGCVRDALLHGPPTRDLDFATSATPKQTENALRQAGGSVFKIGEKFGTIGAIFGDINVEVTSYRAESYQPGSRKPAVIFGKSLTQDLARRDFTINAIALDPRTNKIVDPFNGQEGLTAGSLKAVGSPEERFGEDPLRLLRAVRFAVRLGFEIEHKTSEAICQQAQALGSISRERVRDELDKLLLSAAPARGVALLCDLGLAEHSLPDVPRLRGMQQEGHKDVFAHTLQVLDRTPPRLALRWAGLLHDIAKPRTRRIEGDKVTFHGHDHKGERMARRILGDLHQPSELVDRVGRLVGLHLRANAYKGAWTDSAVRRLVLDVGDDLVEDLLALSRADVTTARGDRRLAIAASVGELERRIRELREQEDIARIASPLDGLELMQLFDRGPGPWIQPIKDYLRELVIEGDLRMDDKEAAVTIATRVYAELGLGQPSQRPHAEPPDTQQGRPDARSREGNVC